jgi:hypothetical protein
MYMMSPPRYLDVDALEVGSKNQIDCCVLWHMYACVFAFVALVHFMLQESRSRPWHLSYSNSRISSYWSLLKHRFSTSFLSVTSMVCWGGLVFWRHINCQLRSLLLNFGPINFGEFLGWKCHQLERKAQADLINDMRDPSLSKICCFQCPKHAQGLDLKSKNQKSWNC